MTNIEYELADIQQHVELVADNRTKHSVAWLISQVRDLGSALDQLASKCQEVTQNWHESRSAGWEALQRAENAEAEVKRLRTQAARAIELEVRAQHAEASAERMRQIIANADWNNRRANAVEELHSEFRVYEPCGHEHTDEDVKSGVAKDVPDVGVVCEDGHSYSICRECCTGGSDYQSEECASGHDLPCYPCRTLRVLEGHGKREPTDFNQDPLADLTHLYDAIQAENPEHDGESVDTAYFERRARWVADKIINASDETLNEGDLPPSVDRLFRAHMEVFEAMGLSGHLLHPPDTTMVLVDVARERMDQDEKFGEQNHLDGTGDDLARERADAARSAVERAAKDGSLTWQKVLNEEVLEAFAEKDQQRLREELAQVAAVAVCWMESIDRREGRSMQDTLDSAQQVEGQP